MSGSNPSSQATRNPQQSRGLGHRGASQINRARTLGSALNHNRFSPLRGVGRSTSGAAANHNQASPNIHPNLDEASRQLSQGETNGEDDPESDANRGVPESDDEEDHIYDVFPWPRLQSGGAEVTTEVLENLLQLDNVHTQLVHRLLQTPSDEQWRVLIMLMGTILNHQLTARQPPVAQELSVSPTPNGGSFSFSTAIKSILRRRIRELLTVGNLEAYTRTQTVAGVPISQTPLVLLNVYLESQSTEFKDEHLPLGWPINHLASQQVVAMMRVLLKHERGHLRNLVLTNVKEFNRHPIDGPVPNLMELIMIIDRAMGGRDEMRPLEAVRQSYTATMKIRIAFIRLEVIHHYLNPDPSSNLTQWDIIDRRLEFLRRQSRSYQNAYARIIIATDKGLFGELEFDLIPKEAINLPTEEDVQAEINEALQGPNHQSALNDPQLDLGDAFQELH